tara:strand:+ start:2492 stop:3175 length:684 start_codon:yes stop_codon:yes gene_type:complete
MKIVSLILARGGSKGIPGKNLMDLCGKPLIQYSIDASLGSCVSETWVSTDCSKIARVAEELGAKVIDRPAGISQDDSKSEEALMHFAQNNSFDFLVFLQPTSPMTTSKHINESIKKAMSYDSLFSGYVEHWTPRWCNNTEFLREVDWNIHIRPMRQAASSKIVENGAIYITKKDALIKSSLRYSGSIGIYEMKRSESFQVDDYDDFFIIESILKNKNLEDTPFLQGI